jgi:hypothetical protein
MVEIGFKMQKNERTPGLQFCNRGLLQNLSLSVAKAKTARLSCYKSVQVNCHPPVVVLADSLLKSELLAFLL